MKLFCTSDIHSYYDELMRALKRKGFDINNPEHVLLVCGDLWDRGPKSAEVYEFIRSIPRERRILIRGNHESLLRELVKRGYPESHDEHNCTYDTLFQFADIGFEDEADLRHAYYKELAAKGAKYGDPLYNNIQIKYRNIRKKLYEGKVKEVLDWIASDEWVNYYETDEYIFVHGWIPVSSHIEFDKWGFPLKYQADTYREDWRNATDTEWEDAAWDCPWKKALGGYNKTGKTIVCGHWHTSDFFNNLTKQRKDMYDCPIFKSKRYKLIGLDACTAGSGKVNVLVIDC